MNSCRIPFRLIGLVLLAASAGAFTCFETPAACPCPGSGSRRAV